MQSIVHEMNAQAICEKSNFLKANKNLEGITFAKRLIVRLRTAHDAWPTCQPATVAY